MLRGILLPLRRLRRTGFRGFLLMLLVLYFGAMLLMQSRSPLPRGDEVRELDQRWDRIGADVAAAGQHRRSSDLRRRGGDEAAVAPANRREGGADHMQDVFDSIRQQEERVRVDRLRTGMDEQRNKLAGLLNQQQPQQQQHFINHNGKRFEQRDNPARPLKFRPRVDDKQEDEGDSNIPPSCTTNKDVEGVFQQPVDGVYLLSAFWDERPNDFDNRRNGTHVRLMAIVRSSARPQLVCHWDLSTAGEFRAPQRTPVAYYEMCENHGRPYGSFILSCAVPDAVAGPPCKVAVGVSESDLGRTPVELEVRTLRPNFNGKRYKATICVPPLFGTVSSAKLVEFFEMSFLLGADRIVLHDFDVPEATRRLVEHFSARCRRDGGCRVDLLRWRLPADVDQGIWYHGQSISLQDCLYRHMASSSHVVFNDIDEFVVPHATDVSDWSQMLDRLDRPGRCALQFNSAFFDPGPDDPAAALDSRAVSLNLVTTRGLRRSNFNAIRTKCMVRPYEIFEAGIHHISKPIWADLEVYRVPNDEAFLHHYRNCVGTMGMDCRGTIEDQIMLRYRENLERTVREDYEQLESVL